METSDFFGPYVQIFVGLFAILWFFSTWFHLGRISTQTKRSADLLEKLVSRDLAKGTNRPPDTLTPLAKPDPNADL